MLNSLLWFKNLKSTTNPKFFPLYTNKSRYLVLLGGGGSGKSIFAGRKILERINCEHNHRILVCRKIAKTIKESCFTQLINQINSHFKIGDFKINYTDYKITCIKTKSEIIFHGLDDNEKLKSIYNITSIWIEEASEITQNDFNQLDIRLRGKTINYKQIILSFNPISVNHWLKKKFFDIKQKNIKVVHSTYKDNVFLDDEQKKVLEDFKKSDEYHYMVYCLGQWGSVGKSVFNNALINNRIENINVAPVVADFDYTIANNLIIDNTIKLLVNELGYIKIFSKPEKLESYCIGCDTASGLENGDNFVAQVINYNSGEQVATMCGNFDEDIFARLIYCLGKYYNNALIGIEVNFSTYPAKELFRLGYENQYLRENIDTLTNKISDKLGFITNKLTRPVILGNLIQITRDNMGLINDIDTLYEMLSFTKDKTGKMCAEYSYHDDRIMALAIAYHIRLQQSFTGHFVQSKINTSHWTQDMIEDYDNADNEGKKYLLKKFNIY